MNTISNNNWSNLPTHKPNPDLWDSIDTNLDLEMVSQNIETLPKHLPKSGLWNSINRSLFYHQYLKYVCFSGVALTIAVIFSILLLNNEKNTSISNIKQKTELINNEDKTICKADQITKVAVHNISLNQNKEIKTSSLRKDITQNKVQIIDSKKSVKTQTLKGKAVEDSFQIQQKLTSNISDNKVLVNDKIKSEQNNINETKQEINTSDSSSKLVEILKEKNTEGAKIPLSKLNIAKSSPEKNWYYSMGIDYSYNVINNKDKFTYSDTKKLNQFGVTGKITYSNWVLQAGVNFSSFNDNTKYKADLRLNKYITYNYVDSVIYSPSGNISQYVTHPVTINNYKDTTQNFLASKKYSMLNIPVLIGYQWRINKVAFTLKTGIQYSLMISEKEELQQQGAFLSQRAPRVRHR